MFSSTQKLYINVSNEPSEISLERALAGDVGTLNLGENGVRLWVPGDNIPLESEIVFDIRLRPLNDEDFGVFKNACKGRFMTSYIALMVSKNPERIEAMLKHYDYVLVPDNNIKNIPADFRKRILSYKANTQK
ncbi:MAG: hypothetical protein ACI9TY_000666 [Alphaproteobacteria bacterium]|jgi:hypothetical protein